MTLAAIGQAEEAGGTALVPASGVSAAAVSAVWACAAATSRVKHSTENCLLNIMCILFNDFIYGEYSSACGKQAIRHIPPSKWRYASSKRFSLIPLLQVFFEYLPPDLENFSFKPRLQARLTYLIPLF
ncbi:hypothetical protein LP414_21035 [Polaromonas sp. P1(28)-13]|nr:hypothetical protein LP414_21035 [Polaromonas sp. P1(28)-13]